MSSTCKKVNWNKYNDNNDDRKETAEEVISRHRNRLEFVMKCHAILGIIFFYKNYPDMFDINPTHTAILGGYLTIPNAHKWRLFWVLGVGSLFKAVEALHYRDCYCLSKFRLYIQTFGMMSIVLGLQVKLTQLEKEYNKVDRDREDLMWNGFPIIFIWIFFFSLAFIIHGLELYTSGALINAWKLQTEFEMKAISNEVK